MYELSKGQEAVRFNCRWNFPEEEVAIRDSIVEVLPIGVIFDSSVEMSDIVTGNGIYISSDESTICSDEHLE